MGKKLKIMAAVAGIILAATSGFCASFHPVTEQERANLGATHVAIFTYADFTQTNVNTAQTFTNVFAVAAKDGVELVAMQLVTAFDTGNTNYTGSVLAQVGDGDDADLYLTSTELASDGTEVFLKFGRSVQAATSVSLNYMCATNVPTITFTLQTATLTNDNNVLAVTNLTGVISIKTNTQTVVSALTDDVTGRKVYTAADKVEFVFTPNSNEALASNTSGEVRFYFKIVR